MSKHSCPVGSEPEASRLHSGWNFFAFTLDYVAFGVAMAFMSVNSVMPSLVRQLTDSVPVIGSINTVFWGVWMVPQLVAANLMKDKPRKKPYLLVPLSGRIGLLVITLALWFGLGRYSTAMLVLLFAGIAMFSLGDGISSVAWFDIVARAMPARTRGRLFGVGQVLSGLLGIGAGALVTNILGNPILTFPRNYALLLALASGALGVSTIGMVLIREAPPLRVYQQSDTQGRTGWFRLLATDAAFRRLMACRVLMAMVGLASPFYVIYAVDVLHLPQSVVGTFVVAQTLGSLVASGLLGLIGDRRGPRSVIRVGCAIGVMGPLFALSTTLGSGGWIVRAYAAVFVALGALYGIYMMGFFNYLAEIAPERERPVYVGAGNTIIGLMTLAPVAGGWLLEITSYRVLFGVTAVLMAAGFVVSLGLIAPGHSD